MTRKSKREIERALDDVAGDAGNGPTLVCTRGIVDPDPDRKVSVLTETGLEELTLRETREQYGDLELFEYIADFTNTDT